MDFNQVEVLEIERTINETNAAVRELGELELALGGGGMGRVRFSVCEAVGAAARKASPCDSPGSFHAALAVKRSAYRIAN